ncbi:DegV family protein [Desulfatitalea alkaliphila]|uniref:DegV family EDD domain-containing protein n=1 Tax=Desulfatitalea alkaliphila TaxID=2929485 RepID=A0AA41R2J5_9BACT|nr:DegV family protein [Desulfatitalea alkaliphila]MCJ8501619.1 DegV family EDD domain-containing protein [Desulfatitalea alkaliphila]
MAQAYFKAFITGYERMVAWSDLLDQINVFPVADADTGRNLKISLAPLRQLADNPTVVPRNLIKSATGNSGNIAAAFFYELLGIDNAAELPSTIQVGFDKAQRAVVNPAPGTMLTLFEALAQAMAVADKTPDQWDTNAIIRRMEETVAATSETLPACRKAGVVDAGALGMFIFLEAFLGCLTDRLDQGRPVTETFAGKLRIADDYHHDGESEDGYCVSAMIQADGRGEAVRRRLADLGESMVVTEGEGGLKVHLHTASRQQLRSGLEALGQVVDWTEERLAPVRTAQTKAGAVHIMTDAAGSVTVEDARELGLTLLNSYLVVGDQSCPETLYAPERLYAAMRAGTKVSTAQASVFERHQSYLSAVSRHERVLYLCVGSVFTGNFETVTAWQAQQDPEQRMTIIDTGVASGRLAVVVLATARRSLAGGDPAAVVAFAHEAVARSREFVFLDQLKYLAAGGRISKTKGFFGDLLHMKPIITPTATGAEKVGVVRNRQDQLNFAMAQLQAHFEAGAAPLIVLQHSDNREWVAQTAAPRIQEFLPDAEVLFRPLSLTSGAHMGPGTWAIAFLAPPDASSKEER